MTAPISTCFTRERALIALGGNLGDVYATLCAARSALGALPQTAMTASSALYRTAAIGPGPQPDYLNAVVAVETALSAAVLLQWLHAIEACFGRERKERWGARTLDLDLLAYGDLCCEDVALRLPHPRIAERMFVLVPLLDIAPDWQNPRSGQTVREMEAALRRAEPVPRVERVVSDGGW